MASTTLRPIGRVGSKAIWFVIGVSVFSMVTSALTAYNDLDYQGLHSFALCLMLIAFTWVIFTVLSKRYSKELKLKIEPLEEKASDGRTIYRVTPTRFFNFLCLEPPSHPGQSPSSQAGTAYRGFPFLKKLSRNRSEQIYVVVIRNTYIDIDVLQALLRFPRLGVIDIQGCKVDPDVWSEFACLPELEHMAVFGAIDEQSERDFHYSLPEVKAIFEPALIVHSSPDTV